MVVKERGPIAHNPKSKWDKALLAFPPIPKAHQMLHLIKSNTYKTHST